MKIVKFKDGYYGIRKGFKLFGYKYLDLCFPFTMYQEGYRPFMYITDSYFTDCKSRNLQFVQHIFNSLTENKPEPDYGIPIEEAK